MTTFTGMDPAEGFANVLGVTAIEARATIPMRRKLFRIYPGYYAIIGMQQNEKPDPDGSGFSFE
jgi:hypothetical protein